MRVLFGIEGHVALDRNPGPGYNTLLLLLVRLHYQTPTITLYMRAMQGGSLYHFYDGLWDDPVGTRTQDLPHERRTRKPLTHPD